MLSKKRKKHLILLPYWPQRAVLRSVHILFSALEHLKRMRITIEKTVWIYTHYFCSNGKQYAYKNVLVNGQREEKIDSRKVHSTCKVRRKCSWSSQ